MRGRTRPRRVMTPTSSRIEDVFFKTLEKSLDTRIVRQKRVQGPGRKVWYVDFYLPEIDTYIQFDGDFWHGKGLTLSEARTLATKKKGVYRWIRANIVKDRQQDAWFEKQKMKLIRIWESDFLKRGRDIVNPVRTIVEEVRHG